MGSVMMSSSLAAIKRRIWSWRNLGCFSQALEEDGLLEDLASTNLSVFVARFKAVLTTSAAASYLNHTYVMHASC
jgi:hypothetical protein